MWSYIHEKNLQNPSNRREILCDAKLKTILFKDRVDMMEIAKCFKDHMKSEGCSACWNKHATTLFQPIQTLLQLLHSSSIHVLVQPFSLAGD